MAAIEFRSLPAIIAERADEAPDRPYIVSCENGAVLTYGEVELLGRRWAGALRGTGVNVGDTVLTMLPPGPPSIGTWIGASLLRAIEVPINTGYRGRMLAYTLDDSLAAIAIVAAEYLEMLAEVLPQVPRIRTVVVVGDYVPDTLTGVEVMGMETFLAQDPIDRPDEMPQGHDIAAILYTSGTTGPSKGVMVTWAQAYLTATGIVPPEHFDDADAFYCPFPMFHMSGKGPLLAMACVAGRVVIRSRFDTTSFWSDVARHQATTTILVGAMVNFLLGLPESPDDARSPLRDAMMLPLPDDVAAFEARFGLRARTTFNMTETSCCILSDGYRLANGTSCGRVRDGFEARVIDEWDREVPRGQLGELVLRSDQPWTLMAGYWNKPEATARAWRNQWLHTGDGFVCDDDGNYYFVDRIKDAIRRRGENVSSAEVEADVNAHPAVLESAAVAVPADDSEDEIKVFVVPRPASEIDPQELIEFLRPRMAAFMLPRYVEVVDALPKTPTEKIRKSDLRLRPIGASTYDRNGVRGERAPIARTATSG